MGEVSGSRPEGVQGEKGKIKWIRSLGNMKKRKRGNGARGKREWARGQREIARKSTQSNPLLFIR